MKHASPPASNLLLRNLTVELKARLQLHVNWFSLSVHCQLAVAVEDSHDRTRPLNSAQQKQCVPKTALPFSLRNC